MNRAQNILIGIVIITLQSVNLAAQGNIEIHGVTSVSFNYLGYEGKYPTPPGETQGFNMQEAIKVSLNGKMPGETDLNCHLDYDGSREQPLEMLINYRLGRFNASFGDIDVVLDETEFGLYNKRLFGLKAGVGLDKLNMSVFGCRTKGISKTKVFKGKIGQEKKYFTKDDYEKRKYYQLKSYIVRKVEVDDLEEGVGIFDEQKEGIDYYIDKEKSVLVFIQPVGENAVIRVFYDDGSDEILKDSTNNINKEIKERYYFLGNTNVIEGTEIIKDTNDARLHRDVNYKIDWTKGVLYFITTTPDYFQADYRYRVKEYALDTAVVIGSERVTVDGKDKQRGIDYYIEYETGRLYFYDEHLSELYDNSVVVIDYETAEGVNSSNLLGLRGRYELFDGLKIGATFLHLEDRKPKTRAKINSASLQHQIIGLDFQYNFLTIFNLSGEIAQSTQQPTSYAVIDDMEGENLITERWKGEGIIAVKNVSEVHHPDEEENSQVLGIKYNGINETVAERYFNQPIDLSQYKGIQLWIRCDGTGSVKLQIGSGDKHYYEYDITPPTLFQYCRIQQDLNAPSIICGKPILEECNRIKIKVLGEGEFQSILYVDDLIATSKNALNGLAKKLAIGVDTERFKAQASFKDAEKGFGMIGQSSFEPISDTRDSNISASFNLIGPITLLAGYKERLKNKSNSETKIKTKTPSGGVIFEWDENNNCSINYEEETEQDCRLLHQINTVNKKYTYKFNYSKDNLLRCEKISLFGRLYEVDTTDRAHGGTQTKSSHLNFYSKLNPISGIELIPKYNYQRAKNLTESRNISNQNELGVDVNFTAIEGIVGILRKSNKEYNNYLLNRKTDDDNLAVELQMTPVKFLDQMRYLTNVKTNLEFTHRKELTNGGLISDNKYRTGNLNLNLIPCAPLTTILMYQFTKDKRISPALTTTKIDEYSADFRLNLYKIIKSLKNIAISSVFNPVYKQRKVLTGGSSYKTYTYFGKWETTYNKWFSSLVQYQLVDEKDRTIRVPYLEIGYSPTNWLKITPKFESTTTKEPAKQTTDYSSSVETVYSIIRDKIELRNTLNYRWNNYDNKTNFTSFLSINISLNSNMNANLGYNWSAFNDDDHPETNYDSHTVNLEITRSF